MGAFSLFGKSKKSDVKLPYTIIGPGYDLDCPEKKMDLILPDSGRKGHTWVFGTTRVGKTRLLEAVVTDDIQKGRSVVVLDPKTDQALFSKIVSVAIDCGRQDDLILVTPIFPQYSAIIDPLSHFYMPEELVGHITSGITVGKEPFFFNVAYEITLVIVMALLMLAKEKGETPSFNMEDIKNYISRDALQVLKQEVDFIEDDSSAKQLSLDMQKILDNPPDYYSKVASSLRVALMELTTGNIGEIIGKSDRNRFLERLDKGLGVIMVVHLGSLLTGKAAFTVGKVILSMIKSYVGRIFSSGQVIEPSMSIHIDEAQNVLFQGIDDLFAKAGGANLWITGYCQSVSQIYAELGPDRGNAILDNCNTKIFMRVPDTKTANYVAEHLGERKRYSPTMQLGGGINIREIEEPRVRPSDVLGLKPRELFMINYEGVYTGMTKAVGEPRIHVEFPQIQSSSKH